MNESFKALADPTRRQILRLLREKDRTAGEIADFFNMSKPSISHHLNALKHAGLIQDERKGQFILYSLDSTVLEEVLGWFLELTSRGKGGEDDTKAGLKSSSSKSNSNPGTILNTEDGS
ncbi:autorepressor SdpR family transcription factor [Paenibacillus piscarius]|uniref:autorepressor SdpR family transcription factor n=1 Tax=Paenibacillus piscarius TaxID=1089681 RepID=UPI001EE8C917|nr:autorepressor SdpR family transcription factor [Paenibacillus piscarius]